jgi:serine/threonine protein kinase
MILVPLLVLALGAALTIIGQLALGSTSRTMARDQFVSHTHSVTHGLDNTLAQAEPLLDELTRIARAARSDFLVDEDKTDESPVDVDRLGVVALELRDLLIGRAGITQAYLAYPDGLFLSADPTDDGRVEIEATKDGISTIYRVEGQKVTQIRVRPSDFDPRGRAWYREAEEKKERIWSRPYTFYFNHHTGVTRSQPIYHTTAKKRLLGVVGVDFDVDALTSFMAGGELQEDDVRSVLFTLRGVVLAYPTAAGRLKEIQGGKQVVSHEALGDPAVTSLVNHVQAHPAQGATDDLLRFAVSEERMLASVRRVGSGGPNWYVATFSPERTVLRQLYSHRRSSLVVAALSLLFSVSLAWFLARRLLEVSREAQLAQDAAEAARSQVRDLGSYRLVSRLGEGGMGEVWRASHRLLARQAAIKLIKPGADDEKLRSEQRERFRREAQAIAGLRSRNTVALFDYGITPAGTLFYVMELLDGIDLSTLVHEHGPQPAERVRTILIQVCNSLSEAHDAQLVHRDIKPANLFLCREAHEVDVVKVLDFGLVFQVAPLNRGDAAQRETDILDVDGDAKESSQLLTQPAPNDPIEEGTEIETRITQAEHQLGTPAFMSPEQALGSPTDGRSDLYSLACVAFFLLTGRTPFSGTSALSLMLKHVEENPPTLSEAMDGPISPEFEALLHRCLEKSPLDRPQSAQKLGRLLRQLGEQQPGFTESDAQAWWQEHRPAPEISAESKFPPLRGAEVLPPARTP